MATTVVIPAATLAAYPTGKAVCQTVGGRPVIIYKASDGAVKVAPNSCAHMGNMGKGSDMLAKFSESKSLPPVLPMCAHEFGATFTAPSAALKMMTGRPPTVWHTALPTGYAASVAAGITTVVAIAAKRAAR